MSLKVYVYDKCSTCKKARQFLDQEGIAYTAIPIREQPPTQKELKQMLKFQDGALRKLFNTSGLDYRALKLRDKLPTMSESEAIELLAGTGNLVKRPFLISSKVGLVGFKEADWKAALKS